MNCSRTTAAAQFGTVSGAPPRPVFAVAVRWCWIRQRTGRPSRRCATHRAKTALRPGCLPLPPDGVDYPHAARRGAPSGSVPNRMLCALWRAVAGRSSGAPSRRSACMLLPCSLALCDRLGAGAWCWRAAASVQSHCATARMACRLAARWRSALPRRQWPASRGSRRLARSLVWRACAARAARTRRRAVRPGRRRRGRPARPAGAAAWQARRTLRPAGFQDVFPVLVHQVGAERAAAEQPHRPRRELPAVPPGERRGRPEPVQHVRRAAQDDRVVGPDVLNVLDRPRLGRQARRRQCGRDPGGDPGGGPVPGGVGNKDPHGVSFVRGSFRDSPGPGQGRTSQISPAGSGRPAGSP